MKTIIYSGIILFLWLMPSILFSQTASCSYVIADSMNILYTGIENPVTIAVMGYPPSKLKIITEGMESWTGTNGKYFARPVNDFKVQKASITVKVKLPNGEELHFGEKKFLIKRIPKPTICLGTLKMEEQTKEMLSVQKAINANLDNFTFEGIKYTVAYCKITIVRSDSSISNYSKEFNGSEIPEEAREQLQTLKSGDMVILSSAGANGPYGLVKDCNSIAYTVE